MTSQELRAALRLMLITSEPQRDHRDLASLCDRAVRGGVTSIQVRSKLMADTELLELCRLLVAELTVPIFVNDRMDIALAAGAAGVHLGSDDLAPSLARQISPPGFVIGASVGSADEATRGSSADYWGIGPIHETPSKPDAGAALGLAGAVELTQLAGIKPVVSIGGITPDSVGPILAAGFAGVAVLSGIMSATDPEKAALAFRSGV